MKEEEDKGDANDLVPSSSDAASRLPRTKIILIAWRLVFYTGNVSWAMYIRLGYVLVA